MGQANFDDILTGIGKYGRYQLYLALLAGLACIPLGVITLANAFLAGIPEYRCGAFDSYKDENSTVLPRGSNFSNVIGVLPWSPKNSSCKESICRDPCNSAFYAHENQSASAQLNCRKWIYDYSVYGSTVVTKWDLVCSSEWMVALGQSTYMAGFMVGSISLGNLSDIFGRKTVCLGSFVLMFLSSVGAAFMPSYWTFIAFRSLSGVAVAGVITTGYVLVMEMTGSKGRLWGGVMYQACFASGFMIVSAMAYVIRDFRYLQLTIGLLVLLYVPYYWLMDESPRWLFTKKRYGEAAALIKKAAKMNRRECPQELLYDHSDAFINDKNEEQTEETKSYSILTVLKYPTLRWRTFNVCFNWFVNCLVYYGLSLGSTNLMGGPYLNLFLSGLVEFPSYLLCVLTASRFGRMKMMSAFMLISGVCCLVFTFLPEEGGLATLIFSLLGKLFISGSFNLIYLTTAEVFPTVVRNLLVGAGCTWARFGGIVTPFIVLTRHYWYPLPMFCFGVLSLAAGLWSLWLPETLNKKLPDTLLEGEQFGKRNSWRSYLPCVGKSNSEKDTNTVV